MPQKRKSKPKVRYDRIISVIVIAILAVYAGKQLFGIGSEKDVPAPSSDANEEFIPVIYLSPSNQNENEYAAGNTNEAEVMREISESTEKYLKENGVTVYIAGSEDSLQEKIDSSNEKKVTAHIAIHSNAGSEKGEGTMCFYNSGIAGSKVLAEYIYNRVSRLTPADDRGMADGAAGKTYMYEVAETESPNCLIEVDFHDTSERAKWLIGHTDETGKAIADGIMEYVDYAGNLHKKITESSETENGKQD